MTSVDDLQMTLGTERWTRRIDGAMKDRARLQCIELRRDRDRIDEITRVVDQKLGDETGDARNLLALLNQEISEIVVQLDGLHWFDEERCARPGTLVQDSGHRIAMIGAHRNAVAIAAHDDQRLLNRIAVTIH